jgi:hypothetical protein
MKQCCKIGLLLSITFSIYSWNLKAQPYWSWVQTAGGSDIDVGWSIATDQQGNSFITGGYQGTATFGNQTLNSHGDYDIFIAKYNAQGQFEWVKSAGGTGSDFANGITLDKDGNIYITGHIRATASFDGITLIYNGISNNIFVAKYSSNGNCIWAKRIASSGAGEGWSIATDRAENLYVAGFYAGSLSFANLIYGASGADGFIAKYSTNGTELWFKVITGLNTEGVYGIATDTSANVYATGLFDSPTILTSGLSVNRAGSWDALILKYDSAGNAQWLRNAGGTAADYGRGIAVDKEGSAYITGSFRGIAAFGALAASGLQNQDNGFVACYNTQGIAQWVRTTTGLTSTSNSTGRGVCVSPNTQELFVSGWYQGSISFSNNTSIISEGQEDIFVWSLDKHGNTLWQSRAGGANNERAPAIAFHSNNHAVITGRLEGTSNFGNQTVVSNSGSRDIFVAKVGNNLTDLFWNEKQLNVQRIFPNPATDYCIIHTTASIDEVRITDLSGKIQHTIYNYQPQQRIDLQYFQKGTYIIRSTKSGMNFISKLIVQ